jgi:hypothetical protein
MLRLAQPVQKPLTDRDMPHPKQIRGLNNLIIIIIIIITIITHPAGKTLCINKTQLIKWVQANPGVNLDIIHIACWRQLFGSTICINKR